MDRRLVRLFPLPQILLFPGTLLPLHVFEDRYRQMVAEALDGDRRIAMVLLKPGWQEDYEGRPPIHAVACMGKIVDHHRLEDGRYNIALAGTSRVRIAREVPGKPFRQAVFETLRDRDEERVEPRATNELIELLLLVGTRAQGLLRQMAFDPPDRSSPAALADRAAAALAIDDATKQALLEDLSVPARIERLRRELEKLVSRHLMPRLGPYEGPPRIDRN